MAASERGCCVPRCGKTRKDNTVLHLFPNPDKELDRYHSWTQAVGLDSSLDPQYVYRSRRVCHAHFETKFLTWSNRLCFGAIPTLLLPTITTASRPVVNALEDCAESVIEKWLLEFEESDTEQEDQVLPLNQPRRMERNDDVSESEDDCLPSDHDSDSECSASSGDDENMDTGEPPNYYYGKNRHKWAPNSPSRHTQTQSHNIHWIPSVPNSLFENGPLSSLETFQHIFDGRILELIMQWTNAKLSEMRNKYPSELYTFRDTNQIELKGFIALLLYTAVFKSNRESVLSIFATDGTGRNIFRASMSKERFLVLLVALRFDNYDDRGQRKKDDPGCAVSELLELFNKNSQQYYVPGANVTVDEMLIAFRGRCKFKMHIPNKPAKYGEKLQVLADSTTFYVINTYLYTGKGSDGRTLSAEEKKLPVPTQAVLRLCKPIYNTNRNVTTDNWYSSIELARELKTRGLTTVGTLKKNKAIIPKEFLPHKDRAEKTSIFGFTKDCTLVSYVQKKNKAVILYSTMHHDDKVNTENQNKPEIVEYYNATKGGVDSVDQKCSTYSCSRRTPRWPMAIFFRIVDMCAWNGYVIFQSQKNIAKTSRLDYIKSVAHDLNEYNLKTRLYSSKLPRQLRNIISEITNIPLAAEVELNEEQKLAQNERNYCHLCPPQLRRETAYLCHTCCMPVCLGCTKKICNTCINNRE